MMKTQSKVSARRLLLILPVVFLLLAGAAFYYFGGNGSATGNADSPAGINASLPDAEFKKEGPADKMSIYELTGSDTAGEDGIAELADKLAFHPEADAQTAEINEKLAAINRQINQPALPVKSGIGSGYSGPAREVPLTRDVERLERLMKQMQPDSAEDPEMRQLGALMDKIIAVQNPGIEKVAAGHAANPGTDSLFQAIPAVVASDQKVVQGSVVALRLLDTVVINGKHLPKGHLVFGLAQFSNQRLNLVIRHVRLGSAVIPVNLTVFDQRDAMPGINAPEALLSEAIGEGSAGAISGIGISGFDLPTQIAGAGLDAAKSLMTRRIKRVKQKVKAGYPVLLRDNAKKLNNHAH